MLASTLRVSLVSSSSSRGSGIASRIRSRRIGGGGGSCSVSGSDSRCSIGSSISRCSISSCCRGSSVCSGSGGGGTGTGGSSGGGSTTFVVLLLASGSGARRRSRICRTSSRTRIRGGGGRSRVRRRIACSSASGSRIRRSTTLANQDAVPKFTCSRECYKAARAVIATRARRARRKGTGDLHGAGRRRRCNAILRNRSRAIGEGLSRPRCINKRLRDFGGTILAANYFTISLSELICVKNERRLLTR